MGILSTCARVWVRAIFAALFRVRVVGTLPRRGPLILVANHQGWADGFLLVAMFRVGAPIRFLADRDGTMGVWWHRAILRWLDLVVPIDRTRATADRSALGSALATLERGGILVIFAEGRVSRAEAALGRLARGVGYLAMRSGAPVQPAWLSGTAELYLGRDLVVAVGAPRSIERAAPWKRATQEIATALHDDLARLSAEWRPRPVTQKRWRWLTDLF